MQPCSIRKWHIVANLQNNKYSSKVAQQWELGRQKECYILWQLPYFTIVANVLQHNTWHLRMGIKCEPWHEAGWPGGSISEKTTIKRHNCSLASVCQIRMWNTDADTHLKKKHQDLINRPLILSQAPRAHACHLTSIQSSESTNHFSVPIVCSVKHDINDWLVVAWQPVDVTPPLDLVNQLGASVIRASCDLSCKRCF